jgi:hypothetical protein
MRCEICHEFMCGRSGDGPRCPECEIHEEIRELTAELHDAPNLNANADDIAAVRSRLAVLENSLARLKELAEEDELIARYHP